MVRKISIGASSLVLILVAAASGFVFGTKPRLYFGSKDMEVTPEESLNAARVMSQRGADVRPMNVGPVGHDSSMLSAAPLILTWLRELEAAAK